MTEHAWLKVVGIAGTLIPIGGALIGLGIYVGNLTNQIEASRSEVQVLKGQVSQLQDILQKTQAAAATGLPGPKGDKGDPGERGEQGPRGERGLPGASTDQEAILSTVKEIVRAEIVSLKSALPASSSSGSTFVDTSGGFDLSKCVPVEQVRKAKTLPLKEGTEVCDDDGSLLVQVTDIQSSAITFFGPGTGSWYIDRGSRNSFDWDEDRIYFIERISSGKEPAATIRFETR